MSKSICDRCACACDVYDRPHAALGRALSAAREIAALLQGECADLLDARARRVATTIARAADERSIWEERFAGPLIGLGDALDALVAASVGPVTRSAIVGCDEEGVIERDVVTDEPDSRLVDLRDRVRALAEQLDIVRDVVAAEESIMRLRQGSQ